MRPIGPGVADPRRADAPRSTLAGGTSDRSGRWPSRVWMTSSPARARGGEQRRGRARSAAREQRDVVAEHLAEAAGLEEIALHVDDDDRHPREIDLDVLRLGGDQVRHRRSSDTEAKQEVGRVG